MSFALQLPQKFHVTNLTNLTIMIISLNMVNLVNLVISFIQLMKIKHKVKGNAKNAYVIARFI